MCCGLSGRSIWWCFLFFLSGFALMGVGIWTPVDDRVFDAVTAFRPGLMDNPAAWRGWIGGLIALGAWSIIVGILGMAGAGCDDDDKVKNSLIAFAVLGSLGTIGCLVLGSMAAAGFATEDKDSYLLTLNVELKQNYYENVENDFTLAWNRYQIDNECCGVEDYRSYEESHYTNATTNVPWSCCVLDDNQNGYYPEQGDTSDGPQCQIEAKRVTPPGTSTVLHLEGCGDEMWDRFRQWQTVVLAISWTATGIQIIALIVTGCLKKDAM